MTSEPTPSASSNAGPGVAPPVLEARSVFRMRQIEGRDVPMVRDVSFQLHKGEFATIMGPSGSGKSTLLHMLAGLDQPSAGEVLVAGEDLGGGDEEYRAAIRRRRIGFIFQFFHLFHGKHTLESCS